MVIVSLKNKKKQWTIFISTIHEKKLFHYMMIILPSASEAKYRKMTGKEMKTVSEFRAMKERGIKILPS